MKTFSFGQIDWTGLKSVLLHTLAGAGLSLALVLLNLLQTYTYGVWTPIALTVFVFLTAFIKKLAETYSVVIPNTPVVLNDTTGTATADTTVKK